MRHPKRGAVTDHKQLNCLTKPMKTLPKAILGRLAVAVLCGLFGQQVQAAPIVGSIDFIGVVTYDTTSLATATAVDIWNSSFVSKDTMDFSSISAGTNANMGAPWTFNSGTPAIPTPGPAKPGLWNVGGFTFDLASSQVVSQSANFLNIAGVGSASGNSFDPTPGTWSFTSTKSSGQDSQTFGFQSSTVVPESGTVVLLASGTLFLASVHFLRRKSKRLLAASWAPF